MAKLNSTKRLRLSQLREKLLLIEGLLGECSRQADVVGAGSLRGRVLFYAKDLRETAARIEELLGRSRGEPEGGVPKEVKEALVAHWIREPSLRGAVRWT